MSANPFPHPQPAMANNTTDHATLLSPPQPEKQESFQGTMDICRPCTPSPSAPKAQDKANATINCEPAQLETPESPLREDFGKSPATAGRPASSHATGLKDPPLFELDTTAPATQRPLFSSFDQSSWDRSTSAPANSTQSTAVIDAAPVSEKFTPSATALDAPPAPRSPTPLPSRFHRFLPPRQRPLWGRKRFFREMYLAEVKAATPRGRLFAVKNLPASKRPRVESDTLPRPQQFAPFFMPNPKAPLKPKRFRKVTTAIPPEELDFSHPLLLETFVPDVPIKSIEPVYPWLHPFHDMSPPPPAPVPRKRQNAPKAPRTQPQPEKEDNNPHWSTIPDYTPPLSSLDDDRAVLEPLNWRGKTRKSFADHEARPHLHAKELVLCEKLAFCPSKYLRSKRQIFEKFVDFQQENHFKKAFNKTAAQGATNIDVTIASALHEAFTKAGWFAPHWFEQYMHGIN